MKKERFFLTGILAIALVFGMAACQTDEGGDPTPTKYTSVDSSSLNVYELVITAAKSATGDSYTLSIHKNDGTLIGKSSGTITVNADSTYTLSNGGTVTISSSGTMTKIDGTIKITGGSSSQHDAPGTVTPVKAGGDNSLDGTWKKENKVVTFSGNSLTYTYIGSTPVSGTATYGSGILVTQGTDWIVAGRYTVDSTKITFTGFDGTMGQYYSGEWIKQ